MSIVEEMPAVRMWNDPTPGDGEYQQVKAELYFQRLGGLQRADRARQDSKHAAFGAGWDEAGWRAKSFS